MPPRIPPPTSHAFAVPSAHTHCRSCLQRTFSTSPRTEARLTKTTIQRREMWAWLNTAGKNFIQPQEGLATTYLTTYSPKSNFTERRKEFQDDGSQARKKTSTDDAPESEDAKALAEAAVQDVEQNGLEGSPYPFPLNRAFASEAVLSEELRLEVWKRVQVDKQSVRQVSADLGIEMRRVGAVVRLVELEKKMRAEGQELALPYAEAIHQMVPVTQYREGQPSFHESINDLPHHPLTTPQLFYPTSESRAFNRTDAGRVFSAAPRLPDSQDIGQGGAPLHEPWQDTDVEIIGKRGHEMAVLKPADARIPHPHLIKHEHDKQDPKLSKMSRAVQKRYEERLQEDQAQRERAHAKKAEAEEARKIRVDTGKWQFVVTEVQAEKGVGTRYGVPSQDRKRGAVKIPTRVEV